MSYIRKHQKILAVDSELVAKNPLGLDGLSLKFSNLSESELRNHLLESFYGESYIGYQLFDLSMEDLQKLSMFIKARPQTEYALIELQVFDDLTLKNLLTNNYGLEIHTIDGQPTDSFMESEIETDIGLIPTLVCSEIHIENPLFGRSGKKDIYLDYHGLIKQKEVNGKIELQVYDFTNRRNVTVTFCRVETLESDEILGITECNVGDET